jgi:iron complex transport system permease protein
VKARPLTARRAAAALAVCVLLLLGAAALSLLLGPMELSPGEVLRALRGEGSGTALVVVREVRLPRALLAAMVGAALAVAGAVLQAVLRNPLADPFVLGVSSGCALGAVAAIAWGMGATALGLPLPAVAGGLLAIGIVYFVSREEGTLSTRRMVLAGVVASYFLSAVIMLFLALGQGREGYLETESVLFWLMGDFSSQPADQVLRAAPLLLVSTLASYLLAPGLNLLMVDEEYARSTGLSVERFKTVAFLLASLATGAAVAAAGSIGFVGLIVPHAARLLWGSDHRLLLPTSMLLGAAFLMLADTAARAVVSPMELPVGVVTAFCGGPFFLYLLARRG